MTKKIVKRTDANNETLYFYTHSDAVDVGEGSSTKSLTEVIDDTLHKSPQTLTNAEKTQVHANLGTESFVGDRAVRYDEAQVLGSSEKTQALTNLGLNGVDEYPTKNSTNMVRSGGVYNELAIAGVYDVTAHNSNTTFASLSALLSDANLNTLIPTAVRKGGMSIKFVQSSDNKYVQYRLMANTFSTTESDWQGVDAEPVFGSSNLVKSGGVSKAWMEIYGTAGVYIEIYKSVRFEETYGYTANKTTYCCSNKLGKGTYSLPQNNSFFFGVYRYISDNSGQVRYAPSHNAKTFTVEDNDYAIIGIKSNSGSALTSEEYNAIYAWIDTIRSVSGKLTLDEIRGKCASNESAIAAETLRAGQAEALLQSTIDLETYNRKNEDRIIKVTEDNTNVALYGSGQVHLDYLRSKRFTTNGYKTNTSYCSAELTEGNYVTPELNDTPYYISIWKYVSDSEGTSRYSDSKLSRTFSVNHGEKSVIVIRKDGSSALTNDDYTYIDSLTISKTIPAGIFEDIDNIKSVIVIKSTDIEFSTGFSKEVLKELYLPNADSTWKVKRVYAKSSSWKIGIDTGDGVNHIIGLDNVGLEYTNKVLKLIGSNGVFYGYCVLNYRGTDYAVDKTDSVLNVADVTDKTKSVIINEYLSRGENIVLIGDSTFGKVEQNLLGNILSSISTKQVFNCGFGGCDMSWRTSDGSNQYDAMSFSSIVDAIVSNDFTDIMSTALNHPNKRYEISAAELQEVDFTKPTTVILHMGGNDLGRVNPPSLTIDDLIGDLWDWEDELTDYDRTTMLGAFNYGVHKLITTYPHIRFIVCLNRWTTSGAGSTPDYENTNRMEWLDKLKENALRMGISCFDAHGSLGSNKWNKDYYQIDWTHQNIKGYRKMAMMLAAVDKGWLM